MSCKRITTITACLLVLLCVPFTADAQQITTFAGNGAGYSGDGTPAISSGIGFPGAGNFDNNGNYYFVNGVGGNRVRMVDVTGIIHTVAGGATGGFSGDGGPATLAQLYQPYGVVIDGNGNIYIADHGNRRIRKVDGVTNFITTIAGNGTATSTGDGGPATAATVIPYGICMDKFGNIFLLTALVQKFVK